MVDIGSLVRSSDLGQRMSDIRGHPFGAFGGVARNASFIFTTSRARH